jgi:hypothetical protein
MAPALQPEYRHAMTKRTFRVIDRAGLIAGTTFLAVLAGSLVEGCRQGTGYRGPAVQAQATVVVQDDYDYYPGYETYYSRNRHEYVYREGNAWVRRPAPRGVAANVLIAAPSVRMDFHDSPQQHHANVVRSYPKNWTPPGGNHAAKDNREPDNKDDKRDDRKN